MKDQLTFWQVVRMLWDVDGWDGFGFPPIKAVKYRNTNYAICIHSTSRIWDIGPAEPLEVFSPTLTGRFLCWRIRRKIAAKS